MYIPYYSVCACVCASVCVCHYGVCRLHIVLLWLDVFHIDEDVWSGGSMWELLKVVKSHRLTLFMEEVQEQEDKVSCPVHSLIPSVQLYCKSAQEKASSDVGNVVADSALWQTCRLLNLNAVLYVAESISMKKMLWPLKRKQIYTNIYTYVLHKVPYVLHYRLQVYYSAMQTARSDRFIW